MNYQATNKTLSFVQMMVYHPIVNNYCNKIFYTTKVSYMCMIYSNCLIDSISDSNIQ
jgi:hypothetical protein